MRLTLVVKNHVLSCHLMCPSVIFLHGQCVYGDSVWFSTNLTFFSSYHFSPLPSRAAHEKNHSSPLIFFPFRFSPCSLNCDCFIWENHFKLDFFFQFYHPVSHLSNLIYILLISFCLRWFINFIYFLLFHPHSFFFFYVWSSFIFFNSTIQN